jgi:iron complex transport system substrate-binding protein
MGKRRITLIMALVLCVTFVFCGCSSGEVKEASTDIKEIKLTDTLGRNVTLTKPANRVVAVGPGALRLCCYLGNVDVIVGIEQMDKADSKGKPYLIANPILSNLPAIGAGGPNNAPDPEKIVAVKPEVIFSTYALDKAQADNLQSKTGIPVVALSYGKTAVFDSQSYSSIRLIGKVIGQEQRAESVVGYMEKCKFDLDARTKEIPEDKKPTTYVGGLGMRGTHGIESTQGNYALFNAVHAKNVVDETGKTGSVMIDKEKLIQWNPDKIFLDAGGFELILQDYKKNPTYYNTLSAVKNGELYSQLPYNFYSTNIDTAIADAYYIGKVLYPEKFADIETEKKADEIYKSLLGKEVYYEMAKNHGRFKKLSLRSE